MINSVKKPEPHLNDDGQKFRIYWRRENYTDYIFREISAFVCRCSGRNETERVSEKFKNVLILDGQDR